MAKKKEIKHVIKCNVADAPIGKITRYNFEIAADGLGSPIYIPVLIAKGKGDGPTICITAALHGNEINGIRVVQRLFEALDMKALSGTIIGVPVVNIPGFLRGERNFDNRVDLNHVMPGKDKKNMSSIYAFRFYQRIVSQCNYLIDLHTASFGRINSYYVRADTDNKSILKMAKLMNPEIILHSKGGQGTLRRAATDRGILAITAELRDPYKFQKKIIKDALEGVLNILTFLKMQRKPIVRKRERPIICERSYWVYTTQGGFLTVGPRVLTTVKKGETIARVRNVFGDLLREYEAPEGGIVIGKSINPVNQTGSRILHLGVPKKEK
jgi:uncharacterized protein